MEVKHIQLSATLENIRRFGLVEAFSCLGRVRL